MNSIPFRVYAHLAFSSSRIDSRFKVTFFFILLSNRSHFRKTVSFTKKPGTTYQSISPSPISPSSVHRPSYTVGFPQSSSPCLSSIIGAPSLTLFLSFHLSSSSPSSSSPSFILLYYSYRWILKILLFDPLHFLTIQSSLHFLL